VPLAGEQAPAGVDFLAGEFGCHRKFLLVIPGRADGANPESRKAA
jgi:hypothetical protein